MAVIALGIDALDPDLVDPDAHPNLALERRERIGTIVSSAGEPSTHELWPSIITGLEPAEHGVLLDDGVAWESPLLRYGSAVADYLLPDGLQARIGALVLNATDADAFRLSAAYYPENGLSTVFDGRESAVIGVPNYVTDPDEEDREHRLRRSMGELFERDVEATGGHTSADPGAFYELCMEMAMVRIARVRRAVRGRRYELVFGYTSGLDLIGHVSYDAPGRQMRAYGELDEFVGELRGDLREGDELLLVSDHGLQEGVHTHEAMVAATSPELVEGVGDVTGVRGAIEAELDRNDHAPTGRRDERRGTGADREVVEQLEDLGYF